MFIETRGTRPSSDRPALLLIHGWAMHGGLFGPLVDRLQDRYTLHLVDLPGHGFARDDSTPLDPAPIAAELAARVPDAVWLGWSLGGQFALRAALDHPDRVRGLVMVASSPCFVRAPDWPHGVGAELFGEFGAALRRDFRGTLEGFLALEALGSAHAQDELRALREQAFARGEPAERALQEGLALLDRLDLRAALPDLAVPSLWISGRRDRLVPTGAMPAAAALAPDARSVVIGNAGHAPFLGAADEVAREIDAFAAEVLGRPALPSRRESSKRHPREGGDPATLVSSPIAPEANRDEQTHKALDDSLRSPCGSSLQDDLRASHLSRVRGNDEQQRQPTTETGIAARMDSP